MAPIKFEENIKDKLEKRAIQPSSGGWEKLSDRLDEEPEENSRKGFWWIGIAASFVGLLIVSSIFFKGSDTNIDTPIIVEDEIEIPIKNDEDVLNEIVEENKVQENQVVSEEIKQKNMKSVKPVVNPIKLVETNKSKVAVSIQKSQIKETKVQEDIVESITYQDAIANIESTKTPEEKKIDEVVGLIQELKKEKSSVTDAEIDALLNQAQKELMSESLYSESTRTVDAELLLLQVETDLDQSFRNKVFEALKTGYGKVKTAVAERNN